ncbi:terminase family protein, partial [Escherichia coli]|nr:terminase family protein [Escherichia coli]
KTTGNGKESIVFPNGAIVYFRTRTKKTGRGLSVDFLVLDECFDLPHETYAALSKLTRARERAQTLFISSPVNRFEHLHGAVMSAKRWAGI